MLENLNHLEWQILEDLPATPNGLSVAELADGLLDNAGPAARGQVRRALAVLDARLGGLAIRRGDDFLGHADVELWGLPKDTHAVVARMFAYASCPDSPSSHDNRYP